jgi:hypothetical protein
MLDFRMKKVSPQYVYVLVKNDISSVVINLMLLDKQELMMLKIDLMSAIADIDDYLDKM